MPEQKTPSVESPVTTSETSQAADQGLANKVVAFPVRDDVDLASATTTPTTEQKVDIFATVVINNPETRGIRQAQESPYDELKAFASYQPEIASTSYRNALFVELCQGPVVASAHEYFDQAFKRIAPDPADQAFLYESRPLGPIPAEIADISKREIRTAIEASERIDGSKFKHLQPVLAA